MSLKIRVYQATYGGGGNRSAFDAFVRGALACGDDCAWTKNFDEECDVAVHPSGPKGGKLAEHRLSKARARLIERYPGRRVVIESPAFREGAEALARRGLRYWRLAWNGFLRGEGDYMNEGSPHDRWERMQAEHEIALRPARRWDTGDILVMLQKRSDASVRDTDIGAWAATVRDQLEGWGFCPVILRQHPLGGVGKKPPAIADALARARAVVTYTSLSAIEAICAGIPTWADGKSLAWPVANKQLSDFSGPGYPSEGDRLQWLADLAYAQWSEEEISSGLAWDRLRRRLMST